MKIKLTDSNEVYTFNKVSLFLLVIGILFFLSVIFSFTIQHTSVSNLESHGLTPDDFYGCFENGNHSWCYDPAKEEIQHYYCLAHESLGGCE